MKIRILKHYFKRSKKVTVILVKSFRFGFAFDVIDRLDAANNPCGLYGSYLLINGDTLFGQEINKIPFELTRFINTYF